MGVNPIDLANSQLRYISEEPVKEATKKEEKYNQEQLNLLYKHPTRSRITRARIMQAYEWLKKNLPEPVTTTGPTIPVDPRSDHPSTGERTPWKEDQPHWTGLFNWTRPNSTQTSIYNKKALIRDDM